MPWLPINGLFAVGGSTRFLGCVAILAAGDLATDDLTSALTAGAVDGVGTVVDAAAVDTTVVDALAG